MKKYFILAVIAAFFVTSCKKGIEVIHNTCKVTQTSVQDYFDQSYEYDESGKLINKTSFTAFGMTFEFEIFRKPNKHLDYAKVLMNGEDAGQINFTYTGDNLTRIDEMQNGTVGASHVITYYPNGLIKTLEHQYGFDPSYNNLVKLEYNAEGVLLKMSRFREGKMYRYESYQLNGNASPAPEMLIMKYGMPQVQFAFYEPNTLWDPGIGTIVQGFEADENGSFKKVYQGELKYKELNQDGYTSYTQWFDGSGNPDRTVSNYFDCGGLKK